MPPDSTLSAPAAPPPGRNPICSAEAETGVLGSILLDADRVLDFCAIRKIRPESFYIKQHQIIYAAIEQMAREGRQVDCLTLAERLDVAGRLREIGGVDYLTRLMDTTPTAAHAEYYLDLVRDKQILRVIVDRARQAEQACYAGAEPADALLDRIEQSFLDIGENRDDIIPAWSDTVKDAVHTLDRILETKKGISGIPTGFRDLDALTMGFHKGDMIVLAARPSMGKTSLAMNIAENIALGEVSDHQARPVAIFSLEMSREQLVMRMLCSQARVPSRDISKGFIDNRVHSELVGAADRLSRAPIFLDDTAGLDIAQLRGRARQLRKKHAIEFIIIDYLQMLRSHLGRSESRQQEIADVSNNIKAMAKELRVPVLVLSQLNRSPEIRDRSGKPRLSDLRDSGSIEQDADVVGLLRRPCKYDDKADVDKALAIIEIAKQRNGPTGEFNLHFDDRITRFFDAAPSYMADDHAPNDAGSDE